MLASLNSTWIDFLSSFDLLLYTLYALLEEEYLIKIHFSTLLSNFCEVVQY